MATPTQEKQSVSASFYALVACLVVALPASVSSLVGGRDSDVRASSTATPEQTGSEQADSGQPDSEQSDSTSPSVGSSELQAGVVAWLRQELDRDGQSSRTLDSTPTEALKAQPLHEFLEAAEAGRIELLGPSIEVIEALDYGRRESLGALEVPGIGRVVFFPQRD